MWNLFRNSMTLFFKGRLFREPRQVMKQWAIGFAITLGCVVLLALLGLPVWLVVILAALVGGALQPWLFKDLKYN
jgi:hypothetical protein